MHFHNPWLAARALALVALVGVSATGCSALLPAHSNSEDTDGEKTVLEFLTPEQLQSAVDANGTKWDRAKWETNRLTLRAPKTKGALLAGVGGAALEALSGMVATALHAEQEKYTAQFEDDAQTKDFWRKDKDDPNLYVQNLAGFRLRRGTTRMPLETSAAFDLVCELQGTGNDTSAKRLKVVPLLMFDRHSKAKVLHLNWAESYSVLWMWLLKSSDSVNITVQVSIDGTWNAPGGAVEDDQGKKEPGSAVPKTNVSLGVVDFSHKLYSIASPALATPKAPTKLVDIPSTYETYSADALTLSLKVVVTEQDSSNATKYLKLLEQKAQGFSQRQ